MGRKSSVDKEKVIELFRTGLTYKVIAEELNSTEEAIRKIVKRNAPVDLSKKRAAMETRRRKPMTDEFTIESSNLLGVDDLKQLMEERRNGINTNESMSNFSYIKFNRQSYITDPKTGILHFDKSRGGVTKDLPTTYTPII